MGMGEDRVTIQVLREIRDEVRNTNDRVDHLTGRVEHVETTLLELAEQQRFVVRWLQAKGDRDQRLEGEVAVLKQRVDALEDRLPARNE
jgi:polyhydroxyalkanoate synthesis regulator phasin